VSWTFNSPSAQTIPETVEQEFRLAANDGVARRFSGKSGKAENGKGDKAASAIFRLGSCPSFFAAVYEGPIRARRKARRHGSVWMLRLLLS